VNFVCGAHTSRGSPKKKERKKGDDRQASPTLSLRKNVAQVPAQCFEPSAPPFTFVGEKRKRRRSVPQPKLPGERLGRSQNPPAALLGRGLLKLARHRFLRVCSPLAAVASDRTEEEEACLLERTAKQKWD
jgi:hypothetical protein